MGRKFFLCMLLTIGGLLLLAGCKPKCDDASLVAPFLNYPGNWNMTSSTLPQLQWTYPDDTCQPIKFRIELTTGPEYTDTLGMDVDGSASTAYPGMPLEPASQYKWRVTAVNGSTLGPPSDWYRFFTPPQCAPGVLNAPTVMYPADGSQVTSLPLTTQLAIVGDCLPEGTGIQVSLDPSFSDQGTFFNGIPALSWTVDDLYDCSTYYIRAYSTYGVEGVAFSESNEFFVNLGNACPGYSIPSSIYGTVWLDKCNVSYGTLPDSIPAGCMLDTTGTVVWGDGIHQPTENGIPNVTVNLGQGMCPSTGYATSVTDAHGFYSFTSLPLGWYCVSIDASTNPLTTPGIWTKQLSATEWTYQSLNMSQSYIISQDFGWYPFTAVAVNSYSPQCPPGQTWNSLSGGCQGECTNDMTWNFQTGQCGYPTSVNCASFTTESACQANQSCIWTYAPFGIPNCVAK